MADEILLECEEVLTYLESAEGEPLVPALANAYIGQYYYFLDFYSQVGKQELTAQGVTVTEPTDTDGRPLFDREGAAEYYEQHADQSEAFAFARKHLANYKRFFELLKTRV